jgi:hypothetical protein
MEFLLIHEAIGVFSPELMKTNMEFGKTIKTGQSPYGTLVSTHMDCAKMRIFCLWDVANVESLLPLLGRMAILGWSTEVIPVLKTPDGLSKIEKTLAEMAKK